LDEFINSRLKAKDKANELEEAWAESERKHRQRRREENREAWRCFYLEKAERLERTAAELAASHRARAAMLGGGGVVTGARECRVCALPPSEVDLVVGGMRSGWSPRPGTSPPLLCSPHQVPCRPVGRWCAELSPGGGG